MRIVGLDVSDARIGIAVTDRLAMIVRDVGVIRRTGGRRDLDAIGRLVGEPTADRFVVGLPLNMDDSEGPAARKIRAFGARLAAHFDVPVEFFDERLTTFDAEQRLRAAKVPRDRRAALRDQVAATLILEGYLASQRS